MKSTRIAVAALVVAVLAFGADAPASAGDTGSRILDSPSRDVYRRDQPTLRSIVPGGNSTASRSLSGIVGGLSASGGLGASSSSDAFGCVVHHQRLDRTTRQLFPSRCDPTADVDTGYPAFTTR